MLTGRVSLCLRSPSLKKGTNQIGVLQDSPRLTQHEGHLWGRTMCSPWQPPWSQSALRPRDSPQLRVDVVQVPLEGLAAQLFPELQPALNTGGKEDTLIPGCRENRWPAWCGMCWPASRAQDQLTSHGDMLAEWRPLWTLIAIPTSAKVPTCPRLPTFPVVPMRRTGGGTHFP